MSGTGAAGQSEIPAGQGPQDAAGQGREPERRRRRRGERRGDGEQSMVPEATFTSYYGRQVVKPAPWENDIPAYMFAGGLAAGSSILAAGGDLTGRPALRRAGRLTAMGALGFSMVALVHDLGRPERFLNMMRTVKLTSPMSVGTWILAAYSPPMGLAAASELVDVLRPGTTRGPLRLARAVGRPAGVAAAALAPPVAAYTAVLLADTATPSWHEAYRELPFVFCASALAAASGAAMVAVPVAQTGPARRVALGAALSEIAAEWQMERSMGLAAEPLHTGSPGRLMRAARYLTAAGAAGSLLAGRSRVAAALSGAALLAGSACTRFGIVKAGIASAKDPKYTVVPQRERVDRGERVRHR
ncbi:NrfD/PsrC family molybdoenzyme membrane anchor subunit [Georgenia sp. AZ-5]|uniref:NrfD/PsrC family molybdoenzyme membrane anchor subunit n=1 Tax=Georgenia sp. AZ-5 TaxID=3367526 RepID=UPI0037542AD7